MTPTTITTEDLAKLKQALEAGRARQAALANLRNASNVLSTAKAAIAPRRTLATLTAELEALRAGSKQQAKAASTAAPKAAARLLDAALQASPEAAAKITARALDHKQGVATRRELRAAFAAANPLQKSSLWSKFQRAFKAFPNEH
jgi:hypothetical protein